MTDAVVGMHQPTATWTEKRPRKRVAPTAPSPAATTATRNGPWTPSEPITEPATAEPAATPASRPESVQPNASCSVPGMTTRPTSEYTHENAGATASPATKLKTPARPIEPAASSGTVRAQFSSINSAYREPSAEFQRAEL